METIYAGLAGPASEFESETRNYPVKIVSSRWKPAGKVKELFELTLWVKTLKRRKRD